MKKRLLPALIITTLIISGCLAFKGKSAERNTLNTLIATTQTYFEIRKIIDIAKPSIPAEYWNEKIVPVDSRIYDAIDTAYEAMKLYNVTKDEMYLNEFSISINEAIKLLPVLRKVTEDAPKEERIS